MYVGLDYYKYENVFLFMIAYTKISTLQRYERFVGNCTFAINKLGFIFFVKKQIQGYHILINDYWSDTYLIRQNPRSKNKHVYNRILMTLHLKYTKVYS